MWCIVFSSDKVCFDIIMMNNYDWKLMLFIEEKCLIVKKCLKMNLIVMIYFKICWNLVWLLWLFYDDDCNFNCILNCDVWECSIIVKNLKSNVNVKVKCKNICYDFWNS